MCTVLLPPGGYPIAVKYISYQMRIVLEPLTTFVVILKFQAACCSWIDKSRNIGLIISPCSTIFIAEHQKLAFSSGQSSRSNRKHCAHISWVVYELIFRDYVHVLCREVNFMFCTRHNFQVKVSRSIIFCCVIYEIIEMWSLEPQGKGNVNLQIEMRVTVYWE
jgi:hypothetical protein